MFLSAERPAVKVKNCKGSKNLCEWGNSRYRGVRGSGLGEHKVIHRILCFQKTGMNGSKTGHLTCLSNAEKV